MTDCKSVVSLPDSFCRLSNLKKLVLWDCNKLGSLPERLGQLGSLKELNLSRCIALEELPAGTPLTSLPPSPSPCYFGMKCI